MCQVEVVSRVMDELSLDHSDQGDFDVNNPKTWSKESVAHIETTLDVNEVTSVYLIPIPCELSIISIQLSTIYSIICM